MQNKPTVLIVEDDAGVLAYTSNMLQANGYRTLTAENGSSAISMVSSHCPDIVLLNLGLPDMDGLDVLRSVRNWSEIPVIILSARSSENDKVKALDMGADDYIMKPFGSSELLARIRTAMRHSVKMETDKDIAAGKLVCGNLTVDYNQRIVTVGGKDVHLTQNEFKIVLLLAKHCNQVLTYSYIIEQVWGNFAADDRQILRVNMANIRRKIEPDPAEPKYIITEVGVGYRMVDNPERV